jgi:hypothetical protein
MLIKRVYEFDPLACPECGGVMKVVAFIEPPQADVIEKILRHCGLWPPSSPRAPPVGDRLVHDPEDASDEPRFDDRWFLDECVHRWAPVTVVPVILPPPPLAR